MLDLIELATTGRSGGIQFGLTSPEEVVAQVGEEYCESYKGPIPFSSWIVTAGRFEFFFQGIPPRIYGLKIGNPVWTMGYFGGRQCALPVEEVKCGELEITFGKTPWPQLLSLSMAINALQEFKFQAKGFDEKQIDLVLMDEKQSFSLSYLLLAKPIEGGIFDMDYHLDAVRLVNERADAELGKTLPKDKRP